MNISKENIDALNAVIKLTIEKEDYQKRVDDVIKDYRKRVNIPGFRAGKVPASMVKKMYGKSIMADEVNKLVSESLNGFITENKLDLLGEPLPSDNQEMIDFDNAENFDFSFDIAVAPEVSLKLSKREKITQYNIAVTDEMLQQQTDSVLGRFGVSEAIDTVSDKATVKGNFAQVGKEEGITAEDSTLSMAIFKDDKEKAKLEGAKVGDVITFNPKVAFPNDTEISYLLKIEKETAAEVEGDFEFTVTEITEFKNPEFDQELFDKAFGPDSGVTNEEEFNARMKEDLAKNLTMESDYRFQLDAKDKVMNKVEVEFPEPFLKKWLLMTNRDNDQLNAETLETEMPRFLEDLKWQLIQNSLIKENEIKLEDADLMDFAKKTARMQFMQYGLSNIPDEHLENYAKDMLQKEDQRRNIANGAINEKVIAFIKESVKVEEKEVSREDFNKLFEKN